MVKEMVGAPPVSLPWRADLAAAGPLAAPPRDSLPRLLAMAVWAPRVVAFVASIEGRFEKTSLPDWLQSITPIPEQARRPRLSAEEMSRVIWNVLRWNRGRFNNGCFVRSFTRYRFFREMGYPVIFVLGVEERSGEADDGTGSTGAAFEHLRSHAWLTLDGRPFLEFEPERFSGYRVLLSFPGS